jgi:hypothetical protein
VTVGQEVMGEKLVRLISVDDQPTKAVLAQKCMAVFLICSVFDIIFATLFRNSRTPPGEPMRTTV